eukprot:CAMPEP_0168733240 /NCGR_PEP_ID=MMETSP0724-20121128/8191_1 /TAXON_ID=265536 /ORGANISM="Amphiprora sp., Strain CCMP467" /LENGTH=883 /DNA_ID=CAMNT_0008780297 /DNA_START=40 /DNA_END=2691 /DNA_ORIENTATION=-
MDPPPHAAAAAAAALLAAAAAAAAAQQQQPQQPPFDSRVLAAALGAAFSGPPPPPQQQPPTTTAQQYLQQQQLHQQQQQHHMPPPPAPPSFTVTSLSSTSSTTTPTVSPTFATTPNATTPPTTPNNNNNNNNNTTTTFQLQHLRVRARSHVDEAIRVGAVQPVDQTQAYRQAQRRCPQLIRDESDPLLFVRRCSYNVVAAAHRLCRYWTERLQAFGPDRAFLPLDLTGDGALNETDILSLHAGFPALLLPPAVGTTRVASRSRSADQDATNGTPTTTTRQPRQVIFCDRRKFIPSATAENRLRASFYIHKVLNEDDAHNAQTDGVLCFVLLITPRFGQLDKAFVQKAVHHANHIFPTKIHWHFLNYLPLPKAGKASSVESIQHWVLKKVVAAPPPMSRCDTGGGGGSRDATAASLGAVAARNGTPEDSEASVTVHMETRPGEILETLRQMGLPDSGIPLCLGGHWKFEEFFRWCQQREGLERRQRRQEEGSQQQQPSSSSSAAPPPPASSSLHNSSKAAAAAKAPLTAEEKLHKKRLADVIHSRRKRERKRQELQNLQEESASRKVENEKLRVEHARLQGLVAEAQDYIAKLPGAVKAVKATARGGGGSSATQDKNKKVNTVIKAAAPQLKDPPLPASSNKRQQGPLLDAPVTSLNRKQQEQQQEQEQPASKRRRRQSLEAGGDSPTPSLVQACGESSSENHAHNNNVGVGVVPPHQHVPLQEQGQEQAHQPQHPPLPQIPATSLHQQQQLLLQQLRSYGQSHGQHHLPQPQQQQQQPPSQQRPTNYPLIFHHHNSTTTTTPTSTTMTNPATNPISAVSGAPLQVPTPTPTPQVPPPTPAPAGGVVDEIAARVLHFAPHERAQLLGLLLQMNPSTTTTSGGRN